ncbi:hypothetical protein ACNOYE_29865 [Nannocystaceae bacterium ST9]
MRRSSVLLTLSLLAACQQTSNLEQAHESGEPTPTEAANPITPPPVEPPLDDMVTHEAPPASGPTDADGIPLPSFAGAAQLLTPGDPADAVQLRLALVEGAVYRITTIGMLFLPLIDKPTGFAREEDMALSECSEEGATRSCLLTHTLRNYEAEPPTGAGLEAEERQVSGVISKHRIDASGLRTTPTELAGEAAALANPAAQALADANQFLCVRLPADAVGTGATWKDVCRRRQSGSIVTRDLTWKLAKLETGEEGKRAELHYAGTVWTKDDKGVRKGKVQGVLYFLVDAGEPHLQRERMEFAIDLDKGIKSATDLRYQWAKLGEDGETLIRCDGKPFAQQPRLLNDGRTLGGGPTRDAELPKIADDKGKKSGKRKSG